MLNIQQPHCEIRNGLLSPPPSPQQEDEARSVNLRKNFIPTSDEFVQQFASQLVCIDAVYGSDDEYDILAGTCLDIRASEGLENANPIPIRPESSRLANVHETWTLDDVRRSEHKILHQRDENRVLHSRQSSAKSSSESVRLALFVDCQPIRTFDGQSPQDVSQPELVSTDGTDRVPRPVVILPRNSCFLVDCTLDRRLRPGQRSQKWRTPANQTLDRFVLPFQDAGSRKDILVLGKAIMNLSARERLHRQRSETNDPFGSSRMRAESVAPVLFQSPHQILQATRNHSATQRSTISDSSYHTHVNSLWDSIVSTPRTTNNSGPAVPTYSSDFLQQSLPRSDNGMYEDRLAFAFDIDQANRVLGMRSTIPTSVEAKPTSKIQSLTQVSRRVAWKDNEWKKDGSSGRRKNDQPNADCRNMSFLQILSDMWVGLETMYLLTPCTVLDAPNLRDDFYCSVLAYSPTIRRLAVALGSKVFLWSETTGLVIPPKELDISANRRAYVTSLAFSSTQGGHAILAVGHGDGRIVMYSPIDKEPRYLRLMAGSAAFHISFRPTVIRRQSQRHSAYIADNEVFLVGDESGAISVYFLEWPHHKERFLFGWHGGIVLHARIVVHSQQICGVAWSPNGDYLATGANDNMCCLLQISRILSIRREIFPAPLQISTTDSGAILLDMALNHTTDLNFASADVRHVWKLNAAVKAIAFCPWQGGLVAAGGGSNDRRIHFFHTVSGACLARINCAAQVTSLVWSSSRRQIAATLGFAQPEHPFRIAVYSWPDCQQIVAIPWHDEMRALYAIPYPLSQALGKKARIGRKAISHAYSESCLVIAGSDGSIKFHEVWSEDRKTIGRQSGALGGSSILEGLHGLDKDSLDTIR